jgi:hypothetical protein
MDMRSAILGLVILVAACGSSARADEGVTVTAPRWLVALDRFVTRALAGTAVSKDQQMDIVLRLEAALDGFLRISGKRCSLHCSRITCRIVWWPIAVRHSLHIDWSAVCKGVTRSGGEAWFDGRSFSSRLVSRQ